jgi:Ni/Co efflux regulator RcnB
MQMRKLFRIVLSLSVLFFVLGGAMPALAKKPEGAGNGKGGNPHAKQKVEHRRADDRDRGNSANYRPSPAGKKHHRHFNDHHYTVINTYFVEHFRAGDCPPGLARKGNGCLPPGQAKKWHYGHPLPPQVVYYDLPPAVLVHLGPPPIGHKFVRVAQDILMIAVGTGMVVDAMEDIGRVAQ